MHVNQASACFICPSAWVFAFAGHIVRFKVLYFCVDPHQDSSLAEIMALPTQIEGWKEIIDKETKLFFPSTLVLGNHELHKYISSALYQRERERRREMFWQLSCVSDVLFYQQASVQMHLVIRLGL